MLVSELDNVEENLPYLKSAPHLAQMSKILILINNWKDFPLQFIGNKLSDVLVNKPPKYSTKLVFKSDIMRRVPWCNPGTLVGGIEVSEVLFDMNRMNLAMVMTAARWGSFTLNNCTVVNVEHKDDHLLVGLEDKIANVCYEVKTKALLNVVDEERSESSNICFKVPDFLVHDSDGICLPEDDMALVHCSDKTMACMKGEGEIRDAFEELKNIITKHYILRKGDVATKIVESSPNPIKWEIHSSSGRSILPIVKNPVDDICNMLKVKPLRGSQMSSITLEGGHGWFPCFDLYLCSRYGLSESEAKYLTRKYGDQASDLAQLLKEKKAEKSEAPMLEVEVIQACKEMAQTVTQVLKRIEIENESDIFTVADIMAKEIGWTEKFKEKQIGLAQEYFNSLVENEGWKSTSREIFRSEDINEKFLNLQREKFKEKVSNSGKMLHGQLELILENHELFVSEETIDTVLRSVDIRNNGEYSEDEFLEIMKSIYVKTPEEVVENHVQNIIDNKTKI